MGDLVRSLAVVVHLPNLFCAGLGGDVENVGFGDAIDASAESQNDLVGETVGDQAGVVFAGGFVILFAEDLG